MNKHRGFDPIEPAKEVVDILAKHLTPIELVDAVFDEVHAQIARQLVCKGSRVEQKHINETKENTA